MYREPSTRDPVYEEDYTANMAEMIRLAMEASANYGMFVMRLEHERKFD